MKILVTGAGGFVGSALCDRLLADGHIVRAFDNFYKGQCDALIPFVSNKSFEFIQGDITNEESVDKAVKDIQCVVHLAAVVGFPQCKTNPMLARAVNETGTKMLASAAYANNPDTKFIFASTGSVYGKVLDGVCTEQTPLNPQSLYGITKANAEKYILSFFPHAKCYRFATGFGVGRTVRVNLLVNDLVYQAIVNRCLTIFEADAYRTFIHVKDMISAIVFGINNYNSMSHHIYNIGGDNLNTSKRQLAEYISKKTGCLVTYAEIGKDLDARDYKVSYSRIAEEGWCPTISLEKGIDELIHVTKLIRIKHQYD